ncbi:MAG: alpha-amylase family glycosyl hydrolase [Thermomicrobiales bacterium]
MWWQSGVIYQVYPRSFQDTNGDGVGDLNGITRRLDYLEWLGVDAVWTSPVFPSPMADFGYDVSDYTGIHPMFGTLADLDRLVQEAHTRDLRVILDWVPNHTSDHHDWFIESRSSCQNPKRDWYLWRDPAPDGGPPNNWLSVFGGSAWELDEQTGQYYYHAFLKEQPDLNWRNRDVREAMYDTLRFWLDRGVDGFRADVIWHLIKDDEYRDNPPYPGHTNQEWPYHDYVPGKRPYQDLIPLYTTDRPEAHEIIAEIRQVLDEYDQRMMVGEIYLPVEDLVRYYGKEGAGLHLPFNFELVRMPWNAQMITHVIDKYEAALPDGAWPNWVLGNHDNSRIATDIGPEQARVAAILLLTLRGTPTLYYGDELGMQDVHIPPDRVQDPVAKNRTDAGAGRDPERTPMRWNNSENAGFTTGTPWLPIGDDAATVNVERQRDDPSTLLTLYRRLLALRQSEAALSVGSYAPVRTDGDLIGYIREASETRFFIALNLAHTPATLSFDGTGIVEIGTHPDREGSNISSDVELRGGEGFVVRVQG